MSAIESKDLTLGEIFRDFYTVPDYQREYVWTGDEVEQLLSDIRSEQTDDGNAEYFIGSIVTCLNVTGRYDLIDGQQRVTSLFLAFCALRDRLKMLGEVQITTIQNLIATDRVDVSGTETREPRLDLQYEDAGSVIQCLVDGTPFPSGGATRSIANMRMAFQTTTDFYTREFAGDVKALRAFFGYLINRVKLIRVRTDSLARALKIFETINDRGVGLDAMDLLKNLLFIRSKAAEFEQLKMRWKQLVDRLHAADEKPLRFLRYVVLSTYGVEKLREDELYDWFVRNEARVGYGRSPIAFVDMLNAAAQAYVHFMQGLGPNGRPHPDVEALRLLAGKSTRQHLILLLAGRNLAEPLFGRLSRDVERILFVYLITRQNNREFEVLFPNWALEAARIATVDEYEEFSARTFSKRKQELADRFKREFEALDCGPMKRFQLRYIIAKLTQAVDLAAFGSTSEGHRWLSRYCDGGAAHIEHVAPQTPGEEVRAEFGLGADDRTLIWSIGNLALAEAAINHSLGNKPFSADHDAYPKLRPLKSVVYPQSQYLLTRAISLKVEIGKNSAIDRAMSSFAPFLKWNADAIRQRAVQLTRLALRVWDLDTQGT
jgi:hypothetical protein